MEREIAWRLSAREFNDSSVHIPGEEDKSPNYLLTPTGALANRILAIGVLVDIENRGTDEDPAWWARVNGPTGIFFVFAGQYQPEASMALSSIKPPAFVAVTGKTRVYSPDGSDRVYTSLRADTVTVVSEETKDYWTMEVVSSLKERLDAMSIANQLDELTVENLVKEGVRQKIAEGAVMSLKHYGPVALNRYREVMVACLQSLLPEYEGVSHNFSPMGESPSVSTATDSGDQETERAILEIIEELDKTPQGAVWEEVADMALKKGIPIEDLEETVNILIENGDLFEPVLGRIKKV